MTEDNSTYDNNTNTDDNDWNWNEIKARSRKYRKQVATSGKDDDSYYGYEG